MAEYTPLITEAVFTPIRADVVLTAGGMLGIFLVILGIGLIIRIIGR